MTYVAAVVIALVVAALCMAYVYRSPTVAWQALKDDVGRPLMWFRVKYLLAVVIRPATRRMVRDAARDAAET
jgi:hypothetical protein